MLDADAPDLNALQAARWEIGTRIMQHMAFEDRYLFANLVNSPKPAVAATARRIQGEFAKHISSYAEHAKSWTAERVASDWNGYRAMTREQIRLLADRIRQVETELFPLARGMPIDTPRPASMSWTRDAFSIKDSITPPD